MKGWHDAAGRVIIFIDGIFFPTASELGDCDIKRVLSNLGYLIMLLAFKGDYK